MSVNISILHCNDQNLIITDNNNPQGKVHWYSSTLSEQSILTPLLPGVGPGTNSELIDKLIDNNSSVMIDRVMGSV